LALLVSDRRPVIGVLWPKAFWHDDLKTTPKAPKFTEHLDQLGPVVAATPTYSFQEPAILACVQAALAGMEVRAKRKAVAGNIFWIMFLSVRLPVSRCDNIKADYFTVRNFRTT